MRYMKIQITAWRDRALPRSTDTVRKLAAVDETALAARVSTVSDAAKDAALDQADQQRAAILAAEAVEAKAAIDASYVHAMVGKFCYQEITDDETAVAALKDENGNVLDDTAIFEYEIVDTKPAMPAWGTPPATKVNVVLGQSVHVQGKGA